MAIKVYIAESADQKLAQWLLDNGCSEIEYVKTSGIVSEPLSDHPDMFMCRMGADEYAPVIRCGQYRRNPPEISNSVIAGGLQDSAGYLTPGYPQEIAYNAACTGKYFIHNLCYTAPELTEAARSVNMELINVRQGYTKCSTVIVDETSIITYDRGISAPCEKAGMDVLLIRPGYISLPGYDTGFIGGASGRVGKTVAFNGDLSAHPDGARIREFIESRGLTVKWFSEWPLTDIGTIITEEFRTL